mmetsp:Transcript_56860/g.124365  ORF Transcript_56860/g.124365 Transcript_56860/m.124365 type:complete len:1071 (+) Transcript_56860:202-3414(+)|eukprot:CAMPEP_0206586702 /NCGR_PEP_ID=MMETSP0325_2-20121206/37191_1 /ASSEMBLY_ACC=CAM_ASM_000347 /TAXON_ID=2866 /ORGANISM="Crypthecodinium cohnii, Strain Seligo" /LENGTH=1070 /DNA_ID=CAMNT_0054094533 /DNA_START=107 /DNA_END=3319 /DNA_ORIENTATION=+
MPSAEQDGESSGSSDSEEEEQESLDDRMKRITKLGKEGKMEELVKEAKLSDCSPEMLAFASQKSKELGNIAFQKKEYEQALEYYAGALLGDVPEKHKIYSNRSACLFQLGKYTDALVEATKAIKCDRSWSKGYFRAGRAAMEMEYYQEALEMFEKGLDRDPSNKDLITWAEKARKIRNQQQQDKLVKKHTTDYSKFESLTKAQTEEEEQEEMANDPNRVILGDKYYSSSKMEQRQLKAMLGYQEPPPPPFEPEFSMDMVYRHDARGMKTQNPVWDPTSREWRVDAKPAPSRVDYSDSQQAQAIALFLERQSDVQYVDNWLAMLDEDSTPVEVWPRAVRDLIAQMLGPKDGEEKRKKHSMLGDDARWLFLGVGTTLPLLTAARYLPKGDIIANTAHRAFYIADLALTIAKDNGIQKEQIKWIHRPTQDLSIVDPDGEDINNLTGKVDCVVLDYELFDAGLLGKGVLAKINHTKKKLVTANHLIMPMGASVMCAPLEVISNRGNGADGLDWRAVDDTRWGAFYEVGNLDDTESHEPWRALGEVQEVFDFDFTESELKLSGQRDFEFVAAEDGVLNCISFWYRMDLTPNVALDHTPAELRSPSASSTAPVGAYARHAMQWLAAPVEVCKGDTVCVRASYSRSRVRFEVTSPEVTMKDKKVSVPRWLMLRIREEERVEAYRKAIEKALDKIMQQREAIPKLDRHPLRIVHLGAGLGQISMIAAKAAREAGVDEREVETHGCTVVAVEQMPKVVKLARRALKDNDLEQDVFFCSEDVRKLPSQPTRAQLIVTELIDPGLLGEGILVLLNAARIKMCNAFEHQVVPSRGTIWAAAFEFGEKLKTCHGFDMSSFNHYRTNLMVDIDTALENGTARQLSTVFQVLKFDFEKNEMPSSHSIKIHPTDDGKINAIVFWYEVAMDQEGDILLTNWPEAVPPADFAMMEKDLHKPRPLRQAVCNFQGDYIKEVEKGVPIEIDVGYTQAWPQFVWPGTEMVQKESGERMAKPPPMPRHRLHFEKLKTETEDLEKKLQSGLMFDEEMLGDGYAAAERIALEPNGNPNYLIDPPNANYFHMMFFL